MARMPIPLLVLLSGVPAPALPPPPRTLVVGHRGARARFPENTLPALRHALAAGADGVEIDVRVSADDTLVLSHDATLPTGLCRDADGRRIRKGLAIRGLSFEALRRFDCGAVPDPGFPDQQAVPGTPMPSLAQVLDLLAADEPPGARRATLFLELKYEEDNPAFSPPRELFARLVVDLLRDRGFEDRTIVLSFDHPLLRAVRSLAPALRSMPLVDQNVDLSALARREEASWVGPRHGRLTAASVGALHAAGVKVFAWTANTPRDQDRLAALGVDALGTDDPQALVERWKKREPR
jgi:glycerophosphoryl diester phosphodiesterase